MSILHFSLAAGAQDFVNLSDYQVVDLAASSFRLENEGDLTVAGSPAPPLDPDEWNRIRGAGTGDTYEAFAAPVSGPVPTGSPVSTWLSLSLDREWTNITLGSSVFDLSIRDAASQVVLTTGRITLTITS